MKRTAMLTLPLLLLATAAAWSGPGDKVYGKPLTIEQVTPLSEILDQPDTFLGKEIRTKGYIYEMCTDMGCWIAILPAVDSDRMLKVAWAQTDVRFPIGEETDGHWVELQGKVITAEQEAADHAAHMAEEGGEHAEPEHAEMTMATRTVYVCPMHPDATSEEPGVCEACGGMELQPKEVPVPTYRDIAIEGIGAIVKGKDTNQ